MSKTKSLKLKVLCIKPLKYLDWLICIILISKSSGNVAKCHLNPLHILQKKIIRIIYFSSYN